MPAFQGFKAEIAMGGRSIRASRWCLNIAATEVDISVCDDTGAMKFTTDLPRIQLDLECIYTSEDDTFAPPFKILPGKPFTDLLIIFDKAKFYPRILFPTGIWTKMEVTGQVRDAVRFTCSALCTALPRLPANDAFIDYARWNGNDNPTIVS